jgi:hypothetical protein
LLLEQEKPCFHPEAGLFYSIGVIEKWLVLSSVAVAFTAVAQGADTLFFVTAEAEFVRFFLVDAEWTWRPFMTFGAWVQTHMLGVVEVYISVVGLEDLGFGQGGYDDRQNQSVEYSFHCSTPCAGVSRDADLYDSR